MKCPKCGFVSYAGLDQCKKCGYPFVKATPKGSPGLLTSLFPERVKSILHPSAESLQRPKASSSPVEIELPTPQTPLPETAPEPVPSSEESPAQAGAAHVNELPQGWREELSERVENFRKRRTQVQPDADPMKSLVLDFPSPGEPEEDRSEEDYAIGRELGVPAEEDADSGFDMEIGELADARSEDGPPTEALPRGEPAVETILPDTSPVEAEMSLGESVEESPPMEILVGMSDDRVPAEEVAAEEIYLAPLGRRFLAGLTDAVILLLGGVLFGVIFWRFCGRVSLAPFNIAVLGLVSVILIFAYFAVFTAIASSTPGLLWMGCEIRNLGGGHPTPSETFWRAFGVLVSLSALMLGFIWAALDSDGLTWHDRMSGTVIILAQIAPAPGDLKTET